jgi:hypothetical protein
VQWVWALSACLALGACDRPPAAAGAATPAGVVDSILPVAETVRRFRLAHGTAAGGALHGGATSRDELVARFLVALEQADTAAIRTLAIDAGEFIDLYYPNSAYARPPYRQSPAFLWFQFQQNSHKGISRALARYAGRPARFQRYRCAAQPQVLGTSRLWHDCVVHWGLEPDSIRLFGSILEHHGRFKFVSFGNDL